MITIFCRSDLSHLFPFLEVTNWQTTWQGNWSKCTASFQKEPGIVVKQTGPPQDLSEISISDTGLTLWCLTGTLGLQSVVTKDSSVHLCKCSTKCYWFFLKNLNLEISREFRIFTNKLLRVIVRTCFSPTETALHTCIQTIMTYMVLFFKILC